MKNQPKAPINKLRLDAINGVDLNPRGGGLLSCTHTASDVADGGIYLSDPHAEAGRGTGELTPVVASPYR